MLAGVPKRTGHPATAGVQVLHGRAGDARQQRLGWSHQSHGTLMAMRMERDRPGSCAQRQRGPAGVALALEVLLEQRRGRRDDTGFALHVPTKQIGGVLTNRRQAARLEKQNGVARACRIVQAMRH